MDTVVSLFPGARAPSTLPPLAGLGSGRATNPNALTFGEVCWRLDILGRKQGWRIDYLRKLIQHHGFPAPLPAFNQARGEMLTGAEAVHAKASWIRAAVDAWFDGQLPPGARTSAAVEHAMETDALDANAENLAELLRARRRRA